MLRRTSRQVAAALALDEHGGDEEGEVGALDPAAHGLEAVLQRLAEGVLVVGLAELLADRLGQLLAHHLQAGGQAVAGPQHAAEEVERVGDLVGQQLLPLGPAGADQEERPVPAHGPADQAEHGRPGDGPDGQGHAEAQAAGEHQEPGQDGVGERLAELAVEALEERHGLPGSAAGRCSPSAGQHDARPAGPAADGGQAVVGPEPLGQLLPLAVVAQPLHEQVPAPGDQAADGGDQDVYEECVHGGSWSVVSGSGRCQLWVVAVGRFRPRTN